MPRRGRSRKPNKVEAVAEALKTETGHWPDKKTLATVAGVHSRNADNALRTVRAVEDATGHAPEITYTKAQDHHVEARIRAATKELEKAAQAREATFWERVTQEANASCEKRFPNLQERENDVVKAERHWRNVANNHKPISPTLSTETYFSARMKQIPPRKRASGLHGPESYEASTNREKVR